MIRFVGTISLGFRTLSMWSFDQPGRTPQDQNRQRSFARYIRTSQRKENVWRDEWFRQEKDPADLQPSGLAGAATGLLLSFWTTRLYARSGTPDFCASCHVMQSEYGELVPCYVPSTPQVH